MPKILHERHDSGEQRHPGVLTRHPDYFFVRKSGLGRLARISRSELVFVQSDWNYVILAIDRQRYLVHQPLKRMAGYLEGFAFAQVHKRYLVNLDKILEVATKHVMMSDGTQIPIGRHYRKAFLERVKQTSI